MAGMKGRSGTNRGKNQGKPFAEALRLEISAAGTDHRRLRVIARKLLEKAEEGDLQAISQVADRLDGKPAQESSVTVTRVNASELSDNELADIAAGGGDDAADAPVDPQKLN